MTRCPMNEAVSWARVARVLEAVLDRPSEDQAPFLHEAVVTIPSCSRKSSRCSGRMPSWKICGADPSDAIMIAGASSMRRGIVNQSIDASSLRAQEVKLVASVKTNVNGAENSGHCVLRVERPQGVTGFVDEMEKRPIRPRAWNQVEIVGKVDADAERVVIGCFLRGVGEHCLRSSPDAGRCLDRGQL